MYYTYVSFQAATAAVSSGTGAPQAASLGCQAPSQFSQGWYMAMQEETLRIKCSGALQRERHLCLTWYLEHVPLFIKNNNPIAIQITIISSFSFSNFIPIPTITYLIRFMVGPGSHDDVSFPPKSVLFQTQIFLS